MFRKQKQILLLLAVFLAGALSSMAQESYQLSLQDALDMAFDNNTNVLNSKIDLEIAQKKIKETIAIGLPHIDGKSGFTYYPKVPSLPASFFDPNAAPGDMIELGVKQNVVTDFTVSQLIFNGAYFVGLQATKVYYDLSLHNDEKTRLDVNENVINTYHMIQLSEESINILQQNLDNINKTKHEINEMNKQGFVEKTDVDQLEVTANGIRNTIDQVKSNLEMSYRLLKIQTGIDETSSVQLSDTTESYETLTNLSLALIKEPFILENNIDYKLTETSKKIAQLNYKLEKSYFLPVISGYYNRTIKLKSPLFDFAPKDVIGINLSLPIFSSGQRLHTVAQKKLAVEKAENTRILVSKSLFMQANQLQSDLRIKLERYQNQKISKELSDNIYQRTLEKYKQGMATSLDLMNSQNQYLTNLTNYYQDLFDLQGAMLKLEKLYNINQMNN
jgi:outer membrane protein